MTKDGKKKWVIAARKLFNGDIVITDPCYIGYTDETCDSYERCGLVSPTYYGDWGCTVYETDGRLGHVTYGTKKLGKFCADTGMVCVMHLEDAEAFRPGFTEWLEERPWCATIIPKFSGEVALITMRDEEKSDDGHVYEFTELRVHGDGTIDGEESSFESIQTSL